MVDEEGCFYGSGCIIIDSQREGISLGQVGEIFVQNVFETIVCTVGMVNLTGVGRLDWHFGEELW